MVHHISIAGARGKYCTWKTLMKPRQYWLYNLVFFFKLFSEIPGVDDVIGIHIDAKFLPHAHNTAMVLVTFLAAEVI